MTKEFDWLLKYWQPHHFSDTWKYCTHWWELVALLLRLLQPYPGMATRIFLTGQWSTQIYIWQMPLSVRNCSQSRRGSKRREYRPGMATRGEKLYRWRAGSAWLYTRFCRFWQTRSVQLQTSNDRIPTFPLNLNHGTTWISVGYM